MAGMSVGGWCIWWMERYDGCTEDSVDLTEKVDVDGKRKKGT